MLLKSMGITDIPPLKDIPVLYGFKPSFSLPEDFGRLLSPDVFNLIIHPLSKGSAREWGLDNYASLIGLLPEDSFRIFLTGTEEEGKAFRPALSGLSSHYTDLSGKMRLEELIAFISKADALLAASTGPLHIAAAAGIHALGIYPPIRPMHPGRWAPLGKKTKVFVKEVECEKCRKTGDCECMRSVKAEEIASCLKTLREQKNV